MSKISKEFKSGFIFLLAIVTLVYGLKYLKGLNVFQTNKPYNNRKRMRNSLEQDIEVEEGSELQEFGTGL